MWHPFHFFKTLLLLIKMLNLKKLVFLYYFFSQKKNARFSVPTFSSWKDKQNEKQRYDITKGIATSFFQVLQFLKHFVLKNWRDHCITDI